jgi:hypothetical protein
MKTVDIKLMGVVLSYAISENAAEYNQLAKAAPGEDPCHDDAVNKTLFHGSYGAIRVATAKKLVEAGYKRNWMLKNDIVTMEEVEKDGKKVKVFTNAKGKVLTEAQAAECKLEAEFAFFKRICAELGVEPTHFQTTLQAAADACPFDPSARESTPAEKKAGKTHLKVAQQIADNGAIVQVAASLSNILGRMVDVSNPETAVTVLALAIGENEAREAAARMNKYMTLGEG